MPITIEQDAEMFLRRSALDLVGRTSRDDRTGASQELLLVAEDHMTGVANLLVAAADWIRDRRVTSAEAPE